MQVFYVYSRAFRVGGNTFRDSVLYPTQDFAPGVLPAGLNTGTLLNPSQALNRYENYHADTAIPEYHFTMNGVFELPVGKNKRFLNHANKLVDAVLGGYRVAGQTMGIAIVPADLDELGPRPTRSRFTAVPRRSPIAAASSAIPNICGSTDTSRRP
jgi:hypothetical protein